MQLTLWIFHIIILFLSVFLLPNILHDMMVYELVTMNLLVGILSFPYLMPLWLVVGVSLLCTLAMGHNLLGFYSAIMVAIWFLARNYTPLLREFSFSLRWGVAVLLLLFISPFILGKMPDISWQTAYYIGLNSAAFPLFYVCYHRWVKYFIRQGA